MATTPEITGRLEAATEKAENASQIIYDVANGDATTEVPTASGPTPTLKKWFQDLGSSLEPMLAGIPERLDKAILSYPDYAAASAAAATLPDGQTVVAGVDKYIVLSGALTGKSAAVKTAHGDALSDAVSWVTPFAFGAKANGVFNDGPAEAAAHEEANGKAVFYPPGTWNGLSPTGSTYPTDSKVQSLFGRLVAGLPTAPVADPAPTIFIQKNSASTREGATNNIWDGGAVYGELNKHSGTSYGAGITGIAKHSGGSGQVIGGHFRGAALHVNAEVWGGWSYAYSTAVGAKSLIGHEINIKNASETDIGWQLTGGEGNSRGLVIVTADGGGPATHAIYIGAHGASAGTDGWYTGILNRSDSIRPSKEPVEIGNGEVVRLMGASSNSKRYGGMRLHNGVFQYGVSLAEASYLSNCAILMAKDQKIVFGSRPTNGTGIQWGSDDRVRLLGASGLEIGGNKVLGVRQTGWAAPTGLTDSSTFATYTAPSISATPTQAEVQALANACQTASRHLAALINNCLNHGLIGA